MRTLKKIIKWLKAHIKFGIKNELMDIHDWKNRNIKNIKKR